MTRLHIPVFHGISPRTAPRKLETSQSQIAANCELFSGELRPIREILEADTPTKVGTIQSIYLLGSTWLHWIEDVDVARSPLYLRNSKRIHYTGHYNPKSTDDTLAAGAGTDYPTDYYRLGLPRPDAAPTIGTTGGTGNNIDRSYVATFVTAWGEEGPPSPVGTATGPDDAASWDISALDANPPNQWTHAADILSIGFSGQTVTVALNATSNHYLETTEYVTISGATVGTGTLYTDIIGTWEVTRINETTFTFELPSTTSGSYSSGAVINREAPIQTADMVRRLYRTLGGSYRFVADVTGTTYTDTIADADLGELIPFGLSESDWWKAPRGDLKGLTNFPGGSMVGFFGNTLAFSEPHVPSAYPTKYQYTFNNDIVAIAVVGNTVIVATDGFPSILTGYDPGAMSQSQLEIFQACVSKRSMVGLINGAMYASPDGLIYVPSVGLPSIITKRLMKKKDWELYNADSMIAEQYDGRYYGFYKDGGVDSDKNAAIVIDPEEPGATFTTLNLSAEGLHSDVERDSLYFVDSGIIKEFDAGGGLLVYTWLSKLFTTPSPVCMKAAKIKLTYGGGLSSTEVTQSIADAIAAVTADLANTQISASFGADNNFDSGAISGFSVGEYTVAGGPYLDSIATTSTSITAIMRLYAYYDNGTTGFGRYLVYTKDLLSDNKPFRLPGGYLADQLEVEFTCNDVRIHEALLATSMDELASV